MKTQKSIKLLTYSVSLIFILSLIPLYVIGTYAHPSVDDYYYSATTAQIWESTHSLPAVLHTALEKTIYTYQNWQGNFSAVFLMHLQPALFGEQYYSLTPFILLTTFVLSSLFFYQAMLHDVFRAPIFVAHIISLSITFVSLQLTHTPSDSFYWYNGGIYYTFFHGLALILFTLLIKLWHTCSLKKSIFLFFLSIPLAFFIGGGNFPTALLTGLLMSLALMSMIRKAAIRKQSADRRTALFLALIVISFFSAFLLSLTAPGNTIRQSSVGNHTGLVKTFLLSFAYGGYSLANLFSTPCVLLFTFISPLLYIIAKQSGFKFKQPLLVLLFTFGLFCSLGTPVFYAQGLKMPPRITNIIYFCGYIWITFNLIYILGWISRRLEYSISDTTLFSVVHLFKSQRMAPAILSIIITALLTVSFVGQIEVSEDKQNIGSIELTNLPMSVSAIYSLVTGDAVRYDQELSARADYLSSTEETEVSLSPLTAYPELIFHTDITDDPENWKNQHLAIFYGKDAVWIIPSQNPYGTLK
ncbi:MAG: hypothetical protein IJN46_05735 [Lachnospiraceae bacterium]|nr:hypothetical protein [Lachnospiraceae bacterium]